MKIFWIVLSSLVIVAFITTLVLAHKRGGCYTNKWIDQHLKMCLLALPSVLLILSFVLVYFGFYNSNRSGESVVYPLVIALLSIAFFVRQYRFLNKPTDTIKIKSIISCLLSLIIVAVFFHHSKLYRAAQYVELRYYGYDMSESESFDFYMAVYYWSAFILIMFAILEFYFIKWIKIYIQRNPANVSAVSEKPIVECAAQVKPSVKAKSEQLIELKKLLDDGILTQEEFETEKSKTLNQE